MVTERGPTAWALTAISGDKQWGGNTGYEDDPARLYRYDSNVPNHKKIREGDIVVIRDREKVLGYSTISRISSNSGTKELRSCPACGTAAIKRRRNKKPTWRCKYAHEFDTPKVGSKAVTLFEAGYHENFISVSGSISVPQLKNLALRPNDQLSIEELDLPALEKLFLELFDETDLFINAAFREPVLSLPTPHLSRDSVVQERRTVMRSIAMRRGQAAFRKKLMEEYGSTCMVSGCTVVEILEAAHIVPYSHSFDNGIKNGLILRSDLHTLFDLGKLTIEPETLVVRIDPKLVGTDYERYHGEKLLGMTRNSPSEKLLAWRWRYSVVR